MSRNSPRPNMKGNAGTPPSAPATNTETQSTDARAGTPDQSKKGEKKSGKTASSKGR